MPSVALPAVVYDVQAGSHDESSQVAITKSLRRSGFGRQQPFQGRREVVVSNQIFSVSDDELMVLVRSASLATRVGGG